MTIIMSEHDFVDTYPSRPAPLQAAHAASELLAEECRRTKRTLRALDVAAALLTGVMTLAVALLGLHLLARWLS